MGRPGRSYPRSDVKQDETLNFQDHDPYRLGEQRLGEPAGIYLLAGRFHVANYSSRAAADNNDIECFIRMTIVFLSFTFRSHYLLVEILSISPAPFAKKAEF